MKGIRIWLVLGAFLLASGSLWSNTKRTDSELLALGNAKLQHAKVGDKATLRVEDSVATLEGVVPSVGLKQKAEKELSKVDGISRVNNNLRVEDGGGDSAVLAKAVHEVRMYPYYTIFDNVELAAKDGQLTLSGQVAQPVRKDDLGRIMSMIPGVKEVVNNLEVLPLSPYDDQLRLRVARAIYGDATLSPYALRADPPIHIIVKNGNVTLIGVVQSEVDRAVAERDARFAAVFLGLDNQLRTETRSAKNTK